MDGGRLVSSRATIAKLLGEATKLAKPDPEAALTKLHEALSVAREAAVDDDTSVVCEHLARVYLRRSRAKALHFARLAARLAPEEKAAHTALGKTCELYASKVDTARAPRRARALFAAAAKAFAKAASLTKDAEDRNFLKDLAEGARAAAKALG